MKIRDVLTLFGSYVNTGIGTLDVVPTTAPPSLKNPDRVPADTPDEEDDKFFDKLKRDAGHDVDEDEDK